jgi:hypothetical protein
MRQNEQLENATPGIVEVSYLILATLTFHPRTALRLRVHIMLLQYEAQWINHSNPVRLSEAS